MQPVKTDMRLSKQAQNLMKRHAQDTFDSILAELYRRRVWLYLRAGYHNADALIMMMTGDVCSLHRRHGAVNNVLWRRWGYSRIFWHKVDDGVVLMASKNTSPTS